MVTFGDAQTWGLIWLLMLPSLLNSSKPQFPYLSNGMRIEQGWVMSTASLCLAHRTHLLDINCYNNSNDTLLLLLEFLSIF